MARFSGLPSFAFFIIFIAFCFIIQLSDVAAVTQNVTTTSYHENGGEGSLKKKDCPNACTYRCSATSHKKPCMFFCIKCCTKCLCVPSGTYGHKEECPCYNDWKTQEGKPKCP